MGKRMGWPLFAAAMVLDIIALGLSLSSFPYYFPPLAVAAVCAVLAAILAGGGALVDNSVRWAAWVLLGVTTLAMANILPRLASSSRNPQERENLRAWRVGPCGARLDWSRNEVRVGGDVYRLEPTSELGPDMPSFVVYLGAERRGQVVKTAQGWQGGPGFIVAILSAECQQRPAHATTTNTLTAPR